MIDVLAGGLGAMLLLMLLSYLESQRRGVELSRQRRLSAEQSRTLTSLSEQLTQQQHAQTALRHTLAEHERTSAERLNQLEALRRQLARVEAERNAVQSLLEQAQAEKAEADRLLARTRGERDAAQSQVDYLEQALAELQRQAQTQQRRLMTLEKDQRDARELRDDIARLQAELARSRDRISALEADVLRWERRAAEAGQTLAQRAQQEKSLAGDILALRHLLADQQAETSQLRRELEQAANRFAGVDLTGRRVVLLVDRSGSMAAVDARTNDPRKWPTVCQTVGQVLDSLRDAEKFQVIVFSEQVSFPLGQEGLWLSRTADSSKQVENALLKMKPEGNTNLYAGMEAAFRFKPLGLDTIFLFSDGLPNIGPGLPPNPPPDEPSQSALLGKHLRETLRTQWNRAEPRVRIHSVGFFYESPNLGAFLWALSRENGGSFVGMNSP